MAGPLSSADPAAMARADILRAAARAVAQHGYHGMSMRELARATGRSPASFYNYFRSKEAVLLAIQSEAFEVLLRAAQDALSHFRAPRPRLYAFILNHVRYFAKHSDVMRVLVHEATALPPESRAAVRDLKARYFELGRGLVKALCADERSAEETERATYCVFGMLNWIYGWYEPEQHGEPTLLARTIFGVAQSGLAAKEPDHAMLESVERQLAKLDAPALLLQPEEIGK
jgi:AcrR family transcriptional regulator